MVFAVNLSGNAWAVQMPYGWQDFMANDTALDDNGFRGYKDLKPRLYRAHVKIHHTVDWETGSTFDFNANLSGIRILWSADQR